MRRLIAVGLIVSLAACAEPDAVTPTPTPGPDDAISIGQHGFASLRRTVDTANGMVCYSLVSGEGVALDCEPLNRGE